MCLLFIAYRFLRCNCACFLFTSVDLKFLQIGHKHAWYRLPKWHSGKELPCQCRKPKRHGFDSWVIAGFFFFFKESVWSEGNRKPRGAPVVWGRPKDGWRQRWTRKEGTGMTTGPQHSSFLYVRILLGVSRGAVSHNQSIHVVLPSPLSLFCGLGYKGMVLKSGFSTFCFKHYNHKKKKKKKRTKKPHLFCEVMPFFNVIFCSQL